MGKEIKLTTGVISANSGFLGDTSLYQISAPIQPGNSGGPIFDFAGNLIGIVSAKHNHADNVGYAVKFTLIKKLLQQQGIQCTTKKTLFGDLPSKVNQLKSSVYSIEVAL